MNKEPDKTWVHLVLGGGGVLSLSYVGALNVLHENGVRFRSVSCCSAGTFIGGLLCARGTPEGLIEDVKNLPLRKLEGRQTFPVPDWFYLMVPGLVALHPMLQWPYAKYLEPGFSEVFQDLLRGRNPTFKELEIRFATAGFDIVQQRFLVYASDTHPEMKVSEALAIAVSIPFAYPPHERKGRIVLDAAVASMCPVWMAADQDTRLPIVALRPLVRSKTGERQSTIEAYWSATQGSAIRGLDDYIITQMSRVKLMEIDCGQIRVNCFELGSDDRMALIDAGCREAERALKRYGKDLAGFYEQPRPTLLGNRDDEKALEKGIKLMTRFHQDLSKEVSNRVFISYSHKDKDWFERFKDALGSKIPISSAWDDTRIEPGEPWRKEIENALNSSRVAVLLLSPNFFSSEFISKKEVPAIVKAIGEDRLIVFPVFIKSDDDGWNVSPLKEFQAANPGRPLDGVSESECNKILLQIVNKIKSIIQVP